MNAADPVHLVLVWRDLRTVDHAALAAACRAGPVLPLYIAEPSLWQATTPQPGNGALSKNP